jgi:gas vesicle protein
MNGLLVGFLMGTVIGATIGMLYAPKPGRETRAMIRDRYQDWRERAGDMAGTAREKAGEFATAARERFRRGGVEREREEEMQGA